MNTYKDFINRKKNIMKNNQFSYYITKYFSEYLPSVKGVSKKTIQSYRDTFVLFLDYIHEVYRLNINKLSMHDIDEIMIEKFLEHLENNRKNSISTTYVPAYCQFQTRKLLLKQYHIFQWMK